MITNTDLEKALALQKAGNINQALNLYNKIIQSYPQNDKAYFFAAIAYRSTQHINMAIDYLQKAIKINPEPIYFKEIGIDYCIAGDIKNSLNYLNDYLDIEPNDLEALNIVGEMYLEANAIDAAIKTFENIYMLDNQNINCLFNMGVAYLRKREFNPSLMAFQKVIELKNDDWQSFFYCAQILKELKNAPKSELFYKKAIELNPKGAELYYNLGILYHICNREDLAVEQYKKALEIKPDYEECYLNFGAAYRNLMDIETEIKVYKQALSKNIKNDHILFNLGTALMTKGDYENGLPLYEHRGGVFPHHKLKFPEDKYPKWNSSIPSKGKTVLVYAVAPDFSYGDTVMFSRFLPKIAELGAKVICRPQSIVRPLLEQSDLNATFIDINENNVEFDYQISVMSLPFALKATPETIPYKTSYLKADEEKVQKYKQKYFDTDKFKVGLCWKSGLGTDIRSLNLESFNFLKELPFVQAYSLQKGFGLDELEKIKDSFDIIDIGATFNDFTDSAAAVKNLDLVITIDTAMSHLAGGLNVPTWVMLPFKHDWRWGMNSNKSAWYESVRLFRQKSPDDWNSIIDEIKSELMALKQ